jgi:hypothetical protein
LIAAYNKKEIMGMGSIPPENIKDIINLAGFLDKKGWLDLPPELFKTHIGIMSRVSIPIGKRDPHTLSKWIDDEHGKERQRRKIHQVE